MSLFSYSLSKFSKVKNILSGREPMLLEDKYLLRNKNYQKKYHRDKLNPWIYQLEILYKQVKSAILIRVLKSFCCLLQPLQLL